MLKFLDVEQKDFDELRRHFQAGIKELKAKPVDDIKKWRKDFDAKGIKNQNPTATQPPKSLSQSRNDFNAKMIENQNRSQLPESLGEIAQIVSVGARAYHIAKGTTHQLLI